jgi:hypothetical protein
MAEEREGRRRKRTKGRNRAYVSTVKLFQNPFPYMSDPEAMVKMQLDGMGVPYSWRFFDAEAPTLKLLIPDFAPEFTLREYKTVIMVIGGFFGTLPGVLDRTALAQVALEYDGWKVALLLEADILKNPWWAIVDKLPELKAPVIRGSERPNPIGAVAIFTDTLNKRRQLLRSLATKRRQFKLDQAGDKTRRNRAVINRSRRRRRRRGRGAFTSPPELRRPTGEVSP